MARKHTSNSLWGNNDQIRYESRRNTARPENNQNDYAVSPMYQNQQTTTRFTVPQEINVVTRVVSDYESENSTVAKTIVQPIAIVPYNTIEQPLYQYRGSEDYYQGGYENYYQQQPYDERDYENYGQPEQRTIPASRASSKKVRVSKVFLFILSLLAIAVMVGGKFLDIEYLKFDSSRSGFEIIMEVTKFIEAGFEIKNMLIPGALALFALINVIMLLDGILGIKNKVCLFEIILALLGVIAMGLFAYLIFKQDQIGYGIYIAGGISVLMLIITLCSHKKGNRS